MICYACEKPATCVGQCEESEIEFCCDDCCGHGNEDGWCIQISLENLPKIVDRANIAMRIVIENACLAAPPKPEARPEGADRSIRVWAEELLGLITVPEKNCSCHISPPCNDCLENSGLREAAENLSAALAAPAAPAAGAWRPKAVWGLQVWNRDNVDSAPEGLYQFFMDGHETELPTVQLFTKKGVSELVIWYSNTGHTKTFAYGPFGRPQPPAPTTGEAG